jgi:hypothetical protein
MTAAIALFLLAVCLFALAFNFIEKEMDFRGTVAGVVGIFVLALSFLALWSAGYDAAAIDCQLGRTRAERIDHGHRVEWKVIRESPDAP